uniref:Uncharacterized protein n=1 Tax=Anguilla anguilla TaxID=7936 RepID=A0A0E9S624_ANGAN
MIRCYVKKGKKERLTRLVLCFFSPIKVLLKTKLKVCSIGVVTD